MKVSKKLLALGLSISIVIASSPISNALSSIDRIKGENIYETAGLIADKQTYETAIIVNLDTSIADGLSASGLSGISNAPILLSQKNSLPSATSKRLNNVKNVYIIGGTNSVSKSVEDGLKSKGITVKRIDGDDRIKTSYNVAKEINSKQKVNTVMLTNAYKGEPDAISIASVAARDKAAIILTDGKSVPFSTSGVKTYAIGGTASMNDVLVKNTNATRLGGSDRFDTNKKIINQFYNGVKKFYIADSSNLTYALIGTSMAKNKPIVIVNDSSNKDILKEATEVTAIGNLSDKIINACINVTKPTKPTEQEDEYTQAYCDAELNYLGQYIKTSTVALKIGLYKAKEFALEQKNFLNQMYSTHLEINSNTELYKEMKNYIYYIRELNQNLIDGNYNKALDNTAKIQKTLDKVSELYNKQFGYRTFSLKENDTNKIQEIESNILININ
ncbi:cell wall-binding repeat-containing protein [Clostridioides difficile]|nr:cell wall-binding repeat-containing protein [Clostridioides difficile]MCC0726825.1 cell wall-binding repeat-containing protein [Clostridioides sp. ZZV14-6045]MCC0730060.1 cell wall-binding repeat-containing protein [Clostridioides sp. ZZV14-6048]MCC0741714.1 cell wall-binding repeat-containing protein [Clostridioides sp. ZZV14-6044]EGT4585075.1 cell wall-binding repeat-containing protein [Clostridioides difficile]EGT5082469.1 cell wall-binding repeat-containing protein [Clostridioides diffi